MRFLRSKSFLVFGALLHTCLLIAMYKYANTFAFDSETKKMDRNEILTSNRTASIPIKKLEIWPEDNPNSDRIVDQISFAEKLAERNKNKFQLKRIYLSDRWTFLSNEFDTFFKDCPVSACQVTQMRESNLDAYLFREKIPFSRHYDIKRQHEIWIYYSLESPFSYGVSKGVDFINWTATYRMDSDIVTPYGKFVQKQFNKSKTKTIVNYAKGKSKKVAWFVSNCGANNNRLEYARELSLYIDVDIYGSCGKRQCFHQQSDKCFEMLRNDYKFYLSFENSNCNDYITEKFFVNALQNNVIPIVMGALKEDYDKLAPPHSFIHVDEFENPKSLAAYLHQLDRNDALYNSYFHWKETGEFIDTRFWCRLCALLNSNYENKHYTDLRKWWQSRDVCSGNKRGL